MTDLKIKTKTVHAVDAFAFEDFVNAQGGKGYSFQADQECGNDTDHEFSVDGEELDEWDQEDVDKTLSGGYGHYVTGALLNHFARQGLIPTGTYLISLNY